MTSGRFPEAVIHKWPHGVNSNGSTQLASGSRRNIVKGTQLHRLALRCEEV
jgi:hypothetical protein